ncbi:glycoside hydrolase family 13 protein [Vibrio gallicus]|uniref:glycoside hydrolase family 13 protein n=1 Tax=Vibrio gallicus TaxID=190897 RepID=UPI0021C44D45|nr:alpha-glucosidase [Vibrio gallicus]
MKKQWWHNAVVYQIYPRSFCDSNNDGIGDINGIRYKLDYLKQLGVDVLWLSPVYKSPMDDNGYDISDYQDIAPEFGTMQDMQALIKEAKQRNIKLVMDLVVNHTSDEHPWFKQARQSKHNRFRDFYIWRDEIPQHGDKNYFESVFGGPAWHWDEQAGQYYFHLFSKKQPDLNWENPEVHKEIHNMMNWWIEQGIGGFRLDVIDLIGKEIDNGISGNGPRLHPLIQQMNRETFGKHELLTVGETWDADPKIAKLYSSPQRNEFSMIFQFEHITLTWKHCDKWNPIPLDLKAFKQVLTKWQLELSNEGWNSLFWNNHDLPRAVSKYGCEGEFRVASAKMLATALHFLKGTPYIYQGEEIGMTNVQFDSLSDYQDIETLNFYDVKTKAGVSHQQMMDAIHKNSRDNARTPMQWSSKPNAGFSDATPWLKVNPNFTSINVASALHDQHSIFYHYQRLIALRKQYPVIVYGDFIPLLQDSDTVFAYIRKDADHQILVVNNFSNQPQRITLPRELHQLNGECLIANYATRHKLDKALSLAPYESFAVKL